MEKSCKAAQKKIWAHFSTENLFVLGDLARRAAGLHDEKLAIMLRHYDK